MTPLIVLLLISPVVIYFSAVFLAFSSIESVQYYELKSPDGKHEIVIVEDGFLMASWCDFYEKTSSFTMNRIGKINNEDFDSSGFYISNINNYEIKWLENGFSIKNGTGDVFSFDFND